LDSESEKYEFWVERLKNVWSGVISYGESIKIFFGDSEVHPASESRILKPFKKFWSAIKCYTSFWSSFDPLYDPYDLICDPYDPYDPVYWSYSYYYHFMFDLLVPCTEKTNTHLSIHEHKKRWNPEKFLLPELFLQESNGTTYKSRTCLGISENVTQNLNIFEEKNIFISWSLFCSSLIDDR